MQNILESGIRLEDVRYVNLYTDYFRLLHAGGKVTYIVAILAEQYSISERKVYDLIKRFQSDCKLLQCKRGVSWLIKQKGG